jgi:large subunit ribosomal protein L21
MFAVVRTGGKQYRVAPGDKIVVEKLDGRAGDQITLGDVLLAGEGSNFQSTDGLTVAAEIIAQAKADKVTVFKKRRRHNYRRKKGHRQQHTILKIVAIGDHKEQKKPAAKAASTAPADAPAAPAKSKSKKVAEAEPVKVEAQPTPNPAPDDQAQANPPVETGVAPAKKPAAPKKAAAPAKAPKAASTKNAAPAKGGAKKNPKAK